MLEVKKLIWKRETRVQDGLPAGALAAPGGATGNPWKDGQNSAAERASPASSQGCCPQCVGVRLLLTTQRSAHRSSAQGGRLGSGMGPGLGMQMQFLAVQMPWTSRPCTSIVRLGTMQHPLPTQTGSAVGQQTSSLHNRGSNASCSSAA